jgi:hypothetical protein
MPTHEETIKIQNAIITLQNAGFDYDGTEMHEKQVIYAFRMQLAAPNVPKSMQLLMMKLTYEALMKESELYSPPSVSEIMKTIDRIVREFTQHNPSFPQHNL